MSEKLTYEELEKRIQELEQTEFERKNAEEAMCTAQQYARGLIEASLDALITISPKGKVTDVNKASELITGLSRMEIIGTDFSNYFTVPDAARKGYQLVFKDGYIRDYPLEIKHRNGSVIPVLYNASVYKDAQGNVAGVFAAARDITERRKMEEAKSATAYLEKLTNSMWDAVFSVKIPERVIEWGNDSFRLIGYEPSEYLGKSTSFLYADTDVFLDFGNKLKDAIAAGKDVFHTEQLLKRKSGEIFPAEITSTFNRENDEVVSITTMIRDITQRKRAETALKKSEKQFQDLFNSINDLIYTQDMKGRFTSANPAMHRLFGYDMDEFLGRRAADFMEPELQSGFSRRYLEVIKEQGHIEGIACYLKKNREKIYIEYNSSLVKPDSSEPYISGIGRDVTERVLSKEKVKNLQEKVAQAQKMESIGTLAGGIAHDFNNILFPILGHTEMLLEDVPEDSPFKESLNRIYTGALRAKCLVAQILTFSNQESNESKLVKIQPIIKEALRLIRATIPTTIEIKQDINPGCGVIKADSTQIHQIVMNLSTNAYHAMEDTGGRLQVSLKEILLEKLDLINSEMGPGTYACLTISDTGIGMNKDLIEKIFDPFFTTKAIGKGTGMGLSVVHGIVTSMGGTIRVYSELGKGTEFNVCLPVEKSSFIEQNIQTKALLQGGTERILIVDDETEIIIMEKQMLERLGYQVTPCNSSTEALEAFRTNPDRFDLIITDMAMPDMPGDKLSVELTKIRPDIPVLLCTGFSEIMSEEKAASLGIKGFLLKPIVMRDFAQKIREVLDK
ncbi:MAG: PAS domain S-box protein [Desulfobacterales bacterium]|nr:PAS domain S-box protein [Desulfobacterales bacterium]